MDFEINNIMEYRKMKKTVILTLSMVFLICFSSMATETRVMTMGDNNNILLDEANVSLYPGRIIEYPNIAVGEFHNDNFTNFGINWTFNEDNPWVLGTYFSTASTVYPDNLMGSNIVPAFSLNSNRKITLLYGRKMGTNNLGFSLDFLSSNTEFGDNPASPQDNSYKQSFNYMDFNFGLTESSGLWDLGLNLGFGSWTDEDSTVTQTEPDGYYDFALRGRYFMQKGPNYTYIPHLSFENGKHAIKDSSFTDTYKRTTINLGMGLNYTPSNSVLAVMDFGVMFDSWKFETDDTLATEYDVNYKIIPYFKLGLDADLFKWMDIRFGATSRWNAQETDYNTYKNKWSYAINQTYLGFGFHWGNLHIDTYANPELFFEGLNFVSGGVEDMNWQLSTVYEF